MTALLALPPLAFLAWLLHHRWQRWAAESVRYQRAAEELNPAFAGHAAMAAGSARCAGSIPRPLRAWYLRRAEQRDSKTGESR